MGLPNGPVPLPNGVIMAEYIWIDGYNKLRGKTRTLYSIPSTVADLPKWNYDGSSTKQAPGDKSDIILVPADMYPDPFRGGDNILVLCETYDSSGNPLPSNTRADCVKVMDAAKDQLPWFGIEQEYFIMDPKTGKPLGFPADGSEPAAQAMYYCGVGAGNIFGRDMVEEHYAMCLQAGLKVSGINAEVAPGQWEFQVGPCLGIEEGDHLWMARYILERLGEKYAWTMNYDPKPIKGDWNGSGAHCNFSTLRMRQEGGLDAAIMPAIENLSKKHKEHIMAYGEGNADRLTGKHETASIDEFRYGTSDRGASIRIGTDTVAAKKGYFEDRRPAGNMDPYVVTKMLLATSLGIPL